MNRHKAFLNMKASVRNEEKTAGKNHSLLFASKAPPTKKKTITDTNIDTIMRILLYVFTYCLPFTDVIGFSDILQTCSAVLIVQRRRQDIPTYDLGQHFLTHRSMDDDTERNYDTRNSNTCGYVVFFRDLPV